MDNEKFIRALVSLFEHDADVSRIKVADFAYKLSLTFGLDVELTDCVNRAYKIITRGTGLCGK